MNYCVKIKKVMNFYNFRCVEFKVLIVLQSSEANGV